MKKVILLLIFAIFVLTGCSGDDSDLVFLGPYVPFNPNDNVIAEELEAISNISVEYQVLADVLTLEKVSLDLSSQTDIDFLKVPMDVYNYLVANDQLLVLNDYLLEYGDNITSSIPQEIWELVEIDGQTYGIPSYTKSSYVENVIFYNKNYVTNVPSTMEEFQDSTCDIAQNNSQVIALDFNNLFYNIELFSSYYNIDYNDPNFFASSEYNEYISYVKALVDCGSIDVNTVNSGIDNKISQFKMGNTAYLIAPFWYILQIGTVEDAKENFGVIVDLDSTSSVKNEQITYMTVIPSYKEEEAIEIIKYINFLFSEELQMTLLFGEENINYTIEDNILTLKIEEENKYQNGWWYLPGNITIDEEIKVQVNGNIYSLETLKREYHNPPDPNDYNYYVVMDQLFDIVESELIFFLIGEQTFDQMVNSVYEEIEYLQSV